MTLKIIFLSASLSGLTVGIPVGMSTFFETSHQTEPSERTRDTIEHRLDLTSHSQ